MSREIWRIQMNKTALQQNCCLLMWAHAQCTVSVIHTYILLTHTNRLLN